MREILEALRDAKRLLLFLDYDGTLVPIRKTPDRAVLGLARGRFLERLARRTFVCVVSGRSLTDVRRLVEARGVAYIGNHGLEISDGRGLWIHPTAGKLRPILAAALGDIRRATARIPGVLVENKGLTGSVHYRLTPARRYPELRDIVATEIGKKRRDLKLTEGKKVFEVRPQVLWDKGKGVREVLRRCGFKSEAVRVYIGDDRTDEDAFRILRRKDVTIFVGRGKPINARFRLRGVPEVWKFLESVDRLLTSRR
jgi:trehalose 6-phosphate phosphatase